MNDRAMYIMIGVIGSGKSTWATAMAERDTNISIVSRDSIREMLNGTYHFIPDLERLVEYINRDAMFRVLMSGRSLIVDECNVTKKNRAELVNWARQRFYGIKIVGVYCPSRNGNVDRRMESPRGYSRDLWQSVFDRMISQFEPPTVDEFDELIGVNRELE